MTVTTENIDAVLQSAFGESACACREYGVQRRIDCGGKPALGPIEIADAQTRRGHPPLQGLRR